MKVRLVIVMMFIAGIALAQGKKIKTIELNSPVVYASVDRPGDLYVVLASADIVKFDKDGNKIGVINFNRVPAIFDARDGIRAFAYFHDDQHIETILPDLSASVATPVHPEFAVNTWLTCPSKNELWIFDAADLSLKKTKDRGTAISFESTFGKNKITSAEQIIYMREYLNFLFVLNKNEGIEIFNNIGKSLKTIALQNINWFNFLGEELYYQKGNQIKFFDLYTSEEREIPAAPEAKFTLLTDERMYAVREKAVDILEFKP